MIIVKDTMHRPIAKATPWEIADSLHVSTEEVMQKAAEGGRIGRYWLEPTEAYVEWLDTLVSYTLPTDGPVLTIEQVCEITGLSYRACQMHIDKFRRMLKRRLEHAA